MFPGCPFSIASPPGFNFNTSRRGTLYIYIYFNANANKTNNYRVVSVDIWPQYLILASRTALQHLRSHFTPSLLTVARVNSSKCYPELQGAHDQLSASKREASWLNKKMKMGTQTKPQITAFSATFILHLDTRTSPQYLRSHFTPHPPLFIAAISTSHNISFWLGSLGWDSVGLGLCWLT